MMPEKKAIIERAKEIWFNEEWKKGNTTSINPTIEELKESGCFAQAVSELMTSIERKNEEWLNTDTVQNIFCDKHIPLDLQEAKRSNILISGTNQQGKTLCACGIADLLMKRGWQIISFDNVGVWRDKSSIPNYDQVERAETVDLRESIILDLSLLKLRDQKRTVENLLEKLWLYRVVRKPEQWCLLIFEEFHLFGKNLRGSLSQNVLRVMSVGANYRIRCLAITPDLSLIDPFFIRLCQQRYHFRLGNEPNAKRRFRAYYGSDWCRVVQELDVGFCVYVNKEKLEVWKIPMFQKEAQIGEISSFAMQKFI